MNDPQLTGVPESNEKASLLNDEYTNESKKILNAADIEKASNKTEDNVHPKENLVSDSASKFTEPLMKKDSEDSNRTESTSIGARIKSFAVKFLKNMHSGFDGIDRGTKK